MFETLLKRKPASAIEGTQNQARDGLRTDRGHWREGYADAFRLGLRDGRAVCERIGYKAAGESIGSPLLAPPRGHRRLLKCSV